MTAVAIRRAVPIVTATRDAVDIQEARATDQLEEVRQIADRVAALADRLVWVAERYYLEGGNRA